MKNINFKISNFNKYLIFLIIILFLYLFYLSIPSLYDKGRLQNDLANKLFKDFNIKFSISSEINYSILPSPNISIKNVKVFKDQDIPKELIQIKELKIFISQSNLFNQNNLKIRNILIKNANFIIDKEDFNFFNDFLNNKFSKKKIVISKSNIFYKDKNKKTIAIFLLSDLKLFYDKQKIANQLFAKGEVFKTPFDTKWTKSFKNNNKNFVFELKQLKFYMVNESFTKDGKYISKNNLKIRNSDFISDFEYENSLIQFNSKNSRLKLSNIEYNGIIKLNPFYFKFNSNLNKINLNKFLINNYFFYELLKTNLLFNNNLNGNISLKSNNIINNKLFDSFKLLLNFNNGLINFNNSRLVSNKIGMINLYSSSVKMINKELVFKARFKFAVNNELEFYKSFQIPKSKRLKLNNIYFDVEFNMFNNKLKIADVKINDINKEINDISELLNNYNNNTENLINNWIDLKIFTNNIFSIYSG